MTSVADLPKRWRERAQDLEPFAASAAEAFRRAATELEDALAAASLEALTLDEASKISGYSVDHLSRMIREGRIPNVGRKGAPRILRRDLPFKPGRASIALPKLPQHSSSGARARRAALSANRRG